MKGIPHKKEYYSSCPVCGCMVYICVDWLFDEEFSEAALCRAEQEQGRNLLIECPDCEYKTTLFDVLEKDNETR